MEFLHQSRFPSEFLKSAPVPHSLLSEMFRRVCISSFLPSFGLAILWTVVSAREPGQLDGFIPYFPEAKSAIVGLGIPSELTRDAVTSAHRSVSPFIAMANSFVISNA